MPNGRTPGVRSHRRGGPRRRHSLAPILLTTTISVLAVAGLGAGYVYFIRGACSGSVTANILVSPRSRKTSKTASRTVGFDTFRP